MPAGTVNTNGDEPAKARGVVGIPMRARTVMAANG
jgi:hypothetical protein